jgi:hypothetical protein
VLFLTKRTTGGRRVADGGSGGKDLVVISGIYNRAVVRLSGSRCSWCPPSCAFLYELPRNGGLAPSEEL